MRRHGGGVRRLAIDKCEPLGVAALGALGIEVCDGQEVMEFARRIKGPEEIACLKASVAGCEAAIGSLGAARVLGMNESELRSILNKGDRQCDELGKSVHERVDLGGRRNIQK